MTEQSSLTTSTKLKVLEGYLQVAKNIRVGYYSQMHETLQVDATIEENFFAH
jgi:ATPase subunit of ABC transporter with duplicated ATPase domains